MKSKIPSYDYDGTLLCILALTICDVWQINLWDWQIDVVPYHLHSHVVHISNATENELNVSITSSCSVAGNGKGPFAYYVITEWEGGGLQMITIHVIVSNTTTVNVTEEGVRNRPKIDYVICERSLSSS